MAQVHWTSRAELDLRDIEDFIARDSVSYAVLLVDRLIQAVEKLSDFPRMGRVVPEFERDDLRELLYRKYRIVYTVRGEDVTVLRVVHGARDFRRVFPHEP